MIPPEDLQHRFSYHAQRDNDIDKFQMIRNIALSFSVVLNELVPDGREKALAITKLEEVVFWGNAGIARAIPDPAAQVVVTTEQA